MLEIAADRIVGHGAVETWRSADESTRAKYLMLGEDSSILASIVLDRVLRCSCVYLVF
jgi:hypothetical protein